MSLVLNYATVQFHTTSDDKDDDTMVVCTVNRITDGLKGPNLAWQESAWGGYLGDNTESPAINLSFQHGETWVSGQEYALTVAIDPNGHDTWRFDCQLILKFQQERQGRTYNFPGHALSQNVRTNTYNFIL